VREVGGGIPRSGGTVQLIADVAGYILSG